MSYKKFSSKIEQDVYNIVNKWKNSEPCYIDNIAKLANLTIEETDKIIKSLMKKRYLYKDIKKKEMK